MMHRVQNDAQGETVALVQKGTKGSYGTEGLGYREIRPTGLDLEWYYFLLTFEANSYLIFTTKSKHRTRNLQD